MNRDGSGCIEARTAGGGQADDPLLHYAMHRLRMLKHLGVTPLIVFDGGLLPSMMSTEGDRGWKRTDALAKGAVFLAEGKKGLARDCFVKAADVTPEIAYQLIKALRRGGIQVIHSVRLAGQHEVPLDLPGPALAFARGIASGEIDPLSRKRMVDFAPDNFQPSQVVVKRSLNAFALVGNLDKAKKENADVGSAPLVARGKFFEGKV
ncbi:hypothetical protein RQP46_011514 [Phenoliferia psychrophenolica]